MPDALLRRRPEPADAAALAALRNACEAVDRLGEHHDPDDCAEELADPRLDRDGSVLVEEDGELVAAQVLYRLGDRLHAAGEVRPDRRGRGIGTDTLTAVRARAAELGAHLEVRVPEAKTDGIALAEGLELAAVRWWSELRCDLARPVAPAPLPDGLELHPLGPEFDRRWDEPLRAAHNAAFADHFGSSPQDATTWAHSRTGSRHFRPSCSAAATTPDGAVAGYLLAEEYEADTAATGVRDLYVASVGTLREWRGRGVAGALLAHALAAAAREGYGRSTLTVDADNPTGALGVYARAGYTLLRRDVTYRG